MIQTNCWYSDGYLFGFTSVYFLNGFVSSKIYDKRDDFDFDIVNFPFLDGDVPRRPSYGVYISCQSKEQKKFC